MQNIHLFPDDRVRRFLLKDVQRFCTKQIKYWYLHEINEKSVEGINGYFDK